VGEVCDEAIGSDVGRREDRGRVRGDYALWDQHFHRTPNDSESPECALTVAKNTARNAGALPPSPRRHIYSSSSSASSAETASCPILTSSRNEEDTLPRLSLAVPFLILPALPHPHRLAVQLERAASLFLPPDAPFGLADVSPTSTDRAERFEGRTASACLESKDRMERLEGRVDSGGRISTERMD
jgi:hypothetical protein